MNGKQLIALAEKSRGKNEDSGPSSSMVFPLYSEKGMALVLTLLILVLITALVTEFSYGVFTTTSALYNWRDSQRLSFIAKSGASLAMRTITEPQITQNLLYKYLGKDIPFDNIVDGFEGRVIVRADDENGKFNLNSLFYQDGKTPTPYAYPIFRRLLKNLVLDETIADRVADWIDTDSSPRQRDSEVGAKNAFMDSVDELLLIKGIDYKTYEKLLPYVTVYGIDSRYDIHININTAAIPVIMSLADNISLEDANAIVNERKLKPFTSSAAVQSYQGFQGVSSSIFVFQPTNFRITSVAEENKIRRVVEIMVKKDRTVKYWREM